MIRIGHGYDVHRLVPGRKLILGGVEIPHTTGLLGHSDADVLTHALMDALLGAAAMGDIGHLFPDSDVQYAGADSLQLLRAVCGQKASEMAAVCASYPQVLINVPVSSKEQKSAIMASEALKLAVAQAEDGLLGSGRVLVRPSGTEALIRVMVEAKEKVTAQTTAEKLSELIKTL